MQETKITSEMVSNFKVLFTTEGVPAIKSDRFTQEEYDIFCQGSRFKHLPENKIWTNEEIADQLYTLLNQNNIPNHVYRKFENKLLIGLPFENKDEDLITFSNGLKSLFGWDNLTPLDKDFWYIFPHCSSIISDKHPPKVFALVEKYGAVGMTGVFGELDYKGYNNMHIIGNSEQSFKHRWEVLKKEKKDKNTVFISQYKNYADFEENVSLKNSKAEGKIFYMDKTKPFNEREIAFNNFGEEDSSIHQPRNYELSQIFSYYNDSDNERHQIIYCGDIVERWLEELFFNRCTFDYSEYRISLKRKPRNYKPSDKAVERLRRYYMEILFLEGIASFEFDW